MCDGCTERTASSLQVVILVHESVASQIETNGRIEFAQFGWMGGHSTPHHSEYTHAAAWAASGVLWPRAQAQEFL